MDLVVVFALFVFMLALLCFCVATVFSVNKDLYKMPYDKTTNFRTNWTNRRTDGRTPDRCLYALRYGRGHRNS